MGFFTSIVVYRELLESTRYDTLFGAQYKGSQKGCQTWQKSLRSSLTLKSKAPNLPRKRLTFLTAMVCSCESSPWRREERKIGIFRYAVPVTKKRTKVSLGTYPHLTLAKARALRDEYLSLLANGIDPQVHNTHKANVCERYCDFNRVLGAVSDKRCSSIRLLLVIALSNR